MNRFPATPGSPNDLYISVIGAGRCTAEQYALAERVGRLVAELGAVLVCGGLSGVMAAAARGAKEAGGRTLGILPGYDRSDANKYIDFAVTTGLGHARNLAVVSSGDAVIAVGGEFGTLSEIGLAAKIGRPVVLLDSWRLQRDAGTEGLWYAETPEEAVALVRRALHLPATAE
ncbi:MAG: TIGR00725 family protein [Thermoleophilia bacterium]